MIIRDQDEQQISDEREVHLPLDIDLPEIVGLGGFKALDRFEGRKGGSLQVMFDQNLPDSFLMDGQAQQVPNPSGTAVRSLYLGPNDLPLSLLVDFVMVAVPMIVEALRSPLLKSAQISIHGTARHFQDASCLLLADLTSENALDSFFSLTSSSLCLA